MTTSSESEQEEVVDPPGRPNAYWAEHKHDVDGYGGNFRGVPVPKRGPQHVTAEQILGDEEHCWCGLEYGHDWPGKSQGKKHPRGEDVSAMVEEQATLSRNDLRAWQKDVADLVLIAVNRLGAKYRKTNARILIYPPDGSRARTVGARNHGGREAEELQKWISAHFDYPGVEKPAPEDLVRLAEALNSPEHPPAPPKVSKAAEPPAVDAEPPSLAVVVATGKPVVEGEWHEHFNREDRPTGFETNGTDYRCLVEGCDYVTSRPQNMGGHRRLVHEKDKVSAQMWHNKEAQEKKADALRYNGLAHKVEDAVAILAKAIGRDLPNADSEKKIKELETSLAAVTARLTTTTAALTEATKRAEEAEAKLSLIREATGL